MGLLDHGYEAIDEADRWREPRDRRKLCGNLGGLKEERGSIWED